MTMPPQLLTLAAVDWNSLAAGVIGAIVGGGFAIAAAWQSHRHNVSLERLQSEQTIDGILHAIRIEWSVMLNEYVWLGDKLDAVKDGDGFTHFFKITRDYFIVYPNNTSIVGQIGDPELCLRIVTAYTKANTFLDAIEVNNQNEERLQELKLLKVSDPPPELFEKQFRAHLNRMAEFVPHLKQSHQELKDEAGKLAKAIDTYRQRHPVKT